MILKPFRPKHTAARVNWPAPVFKEGLNGGIALAVERLNLKAFDGWRLSRVHFFQGLKF